MFNCIYNIQQNDDQIFASLVQIRETDVSIAMQLPSSVHKIVTNSGPQWSKDLVKQCTSEANSGPVKQRFGQTVDQWSKDLDKQWTSEPKIWSWFYNLVTQNSSKSNKMLCIITLSFTNHVAILDPQNLFILLANQSS